jgi:ABC-2 type transport system permease protein
MGSIWIIYKKEMLEFTRSSKWIWLPIVFTLIGIMQPITSYYMPQILDAAGNMPEGTIIKIPTPSGAEVLLKTLSQYSTIGILLIVISAMGSISNEKNTGSITSTMVRPVSYFTFFISKWFAQVTIISASIGIGYGLTWYYTNLLFSNVSFKNFIESCVIYFIYVLFIISVTMCFGSVFRKNGAIVGSSFLLITALAIVNGIFEKQMKWSPSNLMNQVGSILMDNKYLDTLALNLTTSLLIIFGIIFVSIFTLQKQEL